MKQSIFLLVALCCMLTTKATTYEYLVLEKTDGTSLTLTASGLTMTFSEGNLVTNNGTTVALTSLSKMYFTDSSGIQQASFDGAKGKVTVTTLTGSRLGTFSNLSEAKSALNNGVYLFQDSLGNTLKIAVK